jgi:long-chain fatty acid transport protein
LKRLVAIFALLLLAIPSFALAHPFDIFGTGPRAIGMGGAYAAVSDDVAGLYYNVAGIANSNRIKFEFGYLYGEPHLRVNDNDLGVDKNRGTNFGLIVSQTIANHRLSVGANIYIPDDHVIRFMMLPSRSPRFTMYTNRNHALIALIGAGFEIFPWWNIGGGASFLGDNYGGVDFIVSEQSPSEGSLESEIGSLFSPIAGMWFAPTEWLDIGISYREKIQVELDLPNTVSLPELYAFDESGVPLLQESLLALLASSFSHFSPRQFQLGTAWRPNSRFLLTADATYAMWSEFENPTPKTVITLEGGLGELFPIGPADPIPDPEFRDVITPAFGTEFKAVENEHIRFDIRAGYFYRPTPAPDQSGLTNFVDSNTHGLSAGLGITGSDFTEILPQPISLDLYFQTHILETRKVEKDSPSDPTGDYETSGEVFIGGGSMTIRF